MASLALAIMAWAPAASGSAATVVTRGLVERFPIAGRVLESGSEHLRPVVLPPTVAVGNGPDGIVVDPATHTVYTDNQNDNTVSVVNAARCSAKATQGCDQRVHSVALPKGAGPQGIALDQATGTLYVANLGTNSVSVINAKTCNANDFSGCGQIPTVKDPDGPDALAVDAVTDTIYVANCGNTCTGGSNVGDTVSVINGATCNAEDTVGCAQTPPTVAVGTAPDAVAVDSTTDTAYVVNNEASTVSVIDGATCNGAKHSGCGQPPPSITVGGNPDWIALDPAIHTVYAANSNDNTVSVINTASCNATDHSGCGQKTTTVPVGYNPTALTVDSALHTVYVANRGDDMLSVINASICDAADRSGCSHLFPTSQVGMAPQAITLDPSTGTLYVANFVDNTVSVIQAASCDASNQSGCRDEPPVATVGTDPTAVAVDAANSTVYVANFEDSTVSVVDAATCNLTRLTGCARPAATVHVGDAPSSVAVDTATNTVYVTNSGDDTVSVIDAANCNAKESSGCSSAPPTVAVGSGPQALDVDQATDTVYVTNLGPSEDGDTVSVIDGATCNSGDHAGCKQTPPTVTVGVGPFDLAVNQVTNTVYVSDTGQLGGAGPIVGNTVSVIDGATCNGIQHSGCRKALATVMVGVYPFGVAIDQASNTVYVANNNGGDGPASLSVIKGATCDATDTSGCGTTPAILPGVGRAPRGIAFDPSTDTVYTANHDDATVSVVDVDSRTLVQSPPRLAVGGRPLALAIDPTNHTVYVANSADGTLSVLPG
jgi:YVTN family beta-propeller protein